MKADTVPFSYSVERFSSCFFVSVDSIAVTAWSSMPLASIAWRALLLIPRLVASFAFNVEEGLGCFSPPLHIEPSTLRDFAARILPRPGFSLAVRWFSVPNQKTKSSERKRLYRQRWFRHGQRWRTGCEGRISALKRRHGPVVLRIPRHAALGGIDCDRRFPLRVGKGRSPSQFTSLLPG